jgi:thiol-disulfide isomerase/thioredoxin
MIIFAAVTALWTIPAIAQQPVTQQPAAQPQVHVDAATAHFDAVLKQALASLARAKSYTVDVDSKWNSSADARGPQAGSHYRLVSSGGQYRVEVQSVTAQSPDLICVNDGAKVTTYYPARRLYSQHAADSAQATLDENKMLAMSLQGSALDILLERDVAHAVHAQASSIKDRGESIVAGKKAHHFELLWAGAKVELFFAAEGDPLPLQFIRTASVPIGANQHYQMICTASYRWRLGESAPAGTFTIQLPSDAQRVNEIYDALAGHDAQTQVGKPLPNLALARLDGSDISLTAAADKKATVLIFWATWCAASVEDLPAVHKFVAAYKDRGVEFYAVNVGEAPGAVRRFTTQHPLVSTVLIDPRATASGALRINDLPAVAIVGPDNTIRAILHGSASELQAELTAQLDGLLSGSAGKTAQRPGQTVGQSRQER